MERLHGTLIRAFTPYSIQMRRKKTISNQMFLWCNNNHARTMRYKIKEKNPLQNEELRVLIAVEAEKSLSECDFRSKLYSSKFHSKTRFSPSMMIESVCVSA